MTAAPMTPQQVADELGISRDLVYQLIAQGSFGPKGRGYHPVNPLAHHPRYRITPWGLDFYRRQTAA